MSSPLSSPFWRREVKAPFQIMPRSIWMQSFFSFSLKYSPSCENSKTPKDQKTCSLSGRSHSFYNCCHMVSLLKRREHNHPGRVPAAPGCCWVPGRCCGWWPLQRKALVNYKPHCPPSLTAERRKLPLVSFSTTITLCHCRPEYPPTSVLFIRDYLSTHIKTFLQDHAQFQGWLNSERFLSHSHVIAQNYHSTLLPSLLIPNVKELTLHSCPNDHPLFYPRKNNIPLWQHLTCYKSMVHLDSVTLMPVNLSIAHRVTLHGLNHLGYRDLIWTDHVKHLQQFSAKWMIPKSLLGKK